MIADRTDIDEADLDLVGRLRAGREGKQKGRARDRPQDIQDFHEASCLLCDWALANRPFRLTRKMFVPDWPAR